MSLYSRLRPLLFTLPPERAHRLTINGLKMLDQLRASPPVNDHILEQSLMGMTFTNPFGMAAGFDKDGEVMGGVLKAGFGFTEIGTLTPSPQPGNPAPRLFRLKAHEAVINRLGFNNQGQVEAHYRLAVFRARPRSDIGDIVGVNIGANKDSADRQEDYRLGAVRFAGMADYLTVNISSPNTPGLRDLQADDQVGGLMQLVREAAPETPILVKIAPDLPHEQACRLAQLAVTNGIDGLIISNTTIAREAVADSPHAAQEGGLSGQPLFAASTDMLSVVYRETGSKLTLVGVGGVASAQQAYEKICAGASLVQLYTGLVYHGPGLVDRMKRDLADLLRRDGFVSVSAAIGSDHAPPSKKGQSNEG